MSDAQGRWLTYEELGQLIGRTSNGARMFASRRGWPKRSSNRIGERASVLVPTEIAESPPRAMHDAERKFGAVLANGTAERAMARAAIDALTEQLAITNRHLDDERACSARAIERATTAEQRAERAEEKAAGLQAELVDLRVSERVAVTEAADLRQQRDTERARADRIEGELITARAEAAGLRCQLEQARPKPPRTRWQRLLRALGHTR